MEYTSLSHLLKKHWRNTVYSNVWISLGAAAWVKQTELILGVSSGFLLPSFAFFATVCVYNYQRIVKLYNKPSYSVAGRNTWLNRHKDVIKYWAIGGAAVCAILAFFLTFDSLLYLGFGGALSLFYVIKIIPTKNGWITLRDLPYLKIYLIAISWVVLSILFPIVYHQNIWAAFQTTSIILVFEKLLFILAITIPFDTRDLKYDEESKRTLPQILGVKKSTQLAQLILIGSGICSFILFKMSFYSIAILIAILLSCAYTFFLISRTKQSKSELFFTGWLDGTISVQFIMVLIAWMVSH